MFRQLVILIITLIFSVSAETLSKRLDTANQLFEKTGGVLRLNTDTYNLLTNSPRNFGIFVSLTALGSTYNCVPCRYFY